MRRVGHVIAGTAGGAVLVGGLTWCVALCLHLLEIRHGELEDRLWRITVATVLLPVVVQTSVILGALAGLASHVSRDGVRFARCLILIGSVMIVARFLGEIVLFDVTRKFRVPSLLEPPALVMLAAACVATGLLIRRGMPGQPVRTDLGPGLPEVARTDVAERSLPS